MSWTKSYGKPRFLSFRLGVRILGVALLLAIEGWLCAQPAASRVFLNGRIWTGDPDRPRAEALAVADGKLVAVGSVEEVRGLIGKGTEVVDLQGAFVVPGFIDAHQHFLGGSLALERLDLAGCDGLSAFQARLAAHAASHADQPWIEGRGWGYADFPDQMPHRRHLDAILADRPVLLYDRDGHAALVNTKALSLAGITRSTPDPEGGVVVRDASGEPTGLLKESATGLAARHVPKPTPDMRRTAALKGLARAASLGLTSVHEAGAGQEDLAVLDRLDREGRLTLRFYVALEMLKDPIPAQMAAQAELRASHQGIHVRVGAIKAFLDGTVDSRTAWMFDPFVGGGTGLPEWTGPELERAVQAYDRAGWQVMVHAIGDRAIATTLNAYEKAARANGTSGLRHRIEHIEVPRLADLPRFRMLGVVASTQAAFALPDKTTIENYAVLLGPERTARANAFRRFDDAGAMQAFGSDWPVFPNDPLLGIYVAATRQNPDGTPPGGWNPGARIGVEAALCHFTRDAAYAAHEETVKGTLKPGLLADFTVLSQDLLAIPPADLLKTKVLRTVVGGKDTYLAP